MTTPTEPRANGTDSAAERAAAPATRRRSHGTRFSEVAQGATSRVKGTAKKVSGATAARGKAAQETAARVRPKVTAPTDVAANAAETVGSAATKTVGSTARTATKTVGSTARTATKTVGSTVRGAARTVGPVLAGGVGVGFGLLVARAMLLLELIKRIALQVIEALRDLARRLRERSGTDRSTNPSTEADGHSTEPVPM
ncbi:MAG: hypothetical protein QOC75_2076 [Pseudonocardiales bacterium]|nr:hypothetical protein [Pseudonocardiales bacterium]